jgi:hypothetical protein
MLFDRAEIRDLRELRGINRGKALALPPSSRPVTRSMLLPRGQIETPVKTIDLESAR